MELVLDLRELVLVDTLFFVNELVHFERQLNQPQTNAEVHEVLDLLVPLQVHVVDQRLEVAGLHLGLLT